MVQTKEIVLPSGISDSTAAFVCMYKTVSRAAASKRQGKVPVSPTYF